jgi:hypothetical protein
MRVFQSRTFRRGDTYLDGRPIINHHEHWRRVEPVQVLQVAILGEANDRQEFASVKPIDGLHCPLDSDVAKAPTHARSVDILYTHTSCKGNVRQGHTFPNTRFGPALQQSII